MQVTSTRLQAAVTQGIISAPQAQALLAFFAQEERQRPSLRAAHVLMYVGGFVAMGALSLFLTLAWETLGGLGMFGLALVYGVLAWGVTEVLWRQGRYPVAAGLAATLVAAVVPLAGYGLLHALGWWPEASATYTDLYDTVAVHWVTLELLTVVVASLLLWRYGFPLLMLPIVFMLWGMALDLSPVLTFVAVADRQAWASAGFGVLALIAALVLDIRHRRRQVPDLSGWFYVLGTAAFFFGMSWRLFQHDGFNLGYLVLCVLLIALGTVTRQRVMLVFGGLGLVLLLGYWAYDRFADSLWFPVLLSLAGVAIAALGVLWQRHQVAIQNWLDAYLPEAWRVWSSPATKASGA